MNNDFIKVGDRITLSPKGLNYDLKKGKVYNLKYERYEGYSYLEIDGHLTVPSKIYSSKQEDALIDRTLSYFNKYNKSVGVLLEGLKGSGKTLTCKRIANKSELPIIVIDETYPSVKLVEFFTKINTDVVVILDEVEKNKNWYSEDLLSFLDGVQDTCKKIVLMTCNESTKLSDYLKDRCSRVRYLMHFDGLSDEMIRRVIDDKLGDSNRCESVFNFISSNFETKSYDNVIEFINEIKTFPEEDYNELAKLMNINTIDENVDIYNRNRKTSEREDESVEQVSKYESDPICDKCREGVACCRC
mgnify:CR=1 FL=1